MTDQEREANVDNGDDRAPLLSFPPKHSLAGNAINAESGQQQVGQTRYPACSSNNNILAVAVIKC